MKTWYIFFIIELKTRKIVQYACTTNPNIQFLRNQFSAFEYDYPSSMLIHISFFDSTPLCHYFLPDT
jgi:hypothetical protein